LRRISACGLKVSGRPTATQNQREVLDAAGITNAESLIFSSSGTSGFTEAIRIAREIIRTELFGWGATEQKTGISRP
jgi:hypothetical protein